MHCKQQFWYNPLVAYQLRLTIALKDISVLLGPWTLPTWKIQGGLTATDAPPLHWYAAAAILVMADIQHTTKKQAANRQQQLIISQKSASALTLNKLGLTQTNSLICVATQNPKFGRKTRTPGKWDFLGSSWREIMNDRTTSKKWQEISYHELYLCPPLPTRKGRELWRVVLKIPVLNM